MKLPKTGFQNIDSNAAAGKSLRRRAGVVQVKSNVKDVLNAGRKVGMDQKPEFSLSAIHNAWLKDGYMRQALDKFSELLVKQKWEFKGRPECTNYINIRLKAMSMAMQEPYEMLINGMAEDMVKFGNVFLVKAYTRSKDPVPGLSLNGINGKSPVGAYYRIPPEQVIIRADKTGKRVEYVQMLGHEEVAKFKSNDVIHIKYKCPAGQLFGIPFAISAMEDLRIYRQLEDDVSKLVHKYLEPLLNIQVPRNPDGSITQEDLDYILDLVEASAPKGVIVTPEGVGVSSIGAESRALRAEGYLDRAKKRVFTGLSVSEVSMGQGMTSSQTADVMVTEMHQKAKFLQFLLELSINFYIINELLLEGGYDPYNYSEDEVEFCFREMELDTLIKLENHAANMYNAGLLTLSEARDIGNRPSLGEDQKDDMYLTNVQIPLAQYRSMALLSTPFDQSGSIKQTDEPANQHGKGTAPNVGGKKSKTLKNNFAIDILNAMKEEVIEMAEDLHSTPEDLNYEDILQKLNIFFDITYKQLADAKGYTNFDMVDIGGVLSEMKQLIAFHISSGSLAEALASIHAVFDSYGYKFCYKGESCQTRIPEDTRMGYGKVQ